MEPRTNAPFAARWWQRLRGWDWGTILLVLGIKALLFLFAAQVMVTLAKNYDNWMQIWIRWDAIHYLALAQHGYVATGEERYALAFFPLYPWLVRATAFVVRSYYTAPLIVSGFASIAVALIFKQLTRLDESEKVARASVWFLLIFPTTYFLHIGYTEGLFVALCLGCFLAARKDRWLLAGLIGALACLTRVNGLVLVPSLMVEAFVQYRAARRLHFRWLWIALIPLGFLAYLALNYHVTGDWFAFMQIQREHWYKQLASPVFGIRDVWERIPEGSAIEGEHEFFYIVLAFIGGLLCAWKLRASYAIWVLGNWMLVTSTSFVVSVPRYTLTLFPLFILCGRVCARRPLLHALLTVFSLLFLALYAGRFVQGLWAF